MCKQLGASTLACQDHPKNSLRCVVDSFYLELIFIDVNDDY